MIRGIDMGAVIAADMQRKNLERQNRFDHLAAEDRTRNLERQNRFDQWAVEDREKLTSKKNRLNALTSTMSDPNSTNDQRKQAELGMIGMGELPMVNAYRQFNELEQSRAEANRLNEENKKYLSVLSSYESSEQEKQQARIGLANNGNPMGETIMKIYRESDAKEQAAYEAMALKEASVMNTIINSQNPEQAWEDAKRQYQELSLPDVPFNRFYAESRVNSVLPILEQIKINEGRKKLNTENSWKDQDREDEQRHAIYMAGLKNKFEGQNKKKGSLLNGMGDSSALSRLSAQMHGAMLTPDGTLSALDNATALKANKVAGIAAEIIKEQEDAGVKVIPQVALEEAYTRVHGSSYDGSAKDRRKIGEKQQATGAGIPRRQPNISTISDDAKKPF